MTEVEEEEDLHAFKAKLVECEDEMSYHALTIEFSRASAELQHLPGWQKLAERLAAAEQRELEQLRSAEMNQYRLGRRQGLLHGLRLMSSAKPLSEQELALIDSRVTMLRKQIQQYRDLLA